MAVFSSGLLKPLRTRMYFDDEMASNADDPILATVHAARRPFLIARVDGDTATFDIHLQGPDETPFFEA